MSDSASICFRASRKPCRVASGSASPSPESLVLKPDVIVLDEPTSALDVSVQADIVEVLLSLQAKLGLTYVFVSHDLALVRQLAHTVSVMQRGRIVEHGTVTDIFETLSSPIPCRCWNRSHPASPASPACHACAPSHHQQEKIA
jgi:peptide/nickel transport system ATP-binding protein